MRQTNSYEFAGRPTERPLSCFLMQEMSYDPQELDGVWIMAFGKHTGDSLEEVPAGYLNWCLREIPDAPDQFGAILIAEIDRRKHEGCLSFDFSEVEG